MEATTRAEGELRRPGRRAGYRDPGSKTARIVEAARDLAGDSGELRRDDLLRRMKAFLPSEQKVVMELVRQLRGRGEFPWEVRTHNYWSRIAPTPRQEEILSAIRGLYREHGWPPTFRQLMAAMGIRSPNGVNCHLKPLVAKGLLRRVRDGTATRYLPAVPEGCCPCCGRPGE